MSIWYCETHGLTGPGTQLPGVCDHCGKGMSRATTAADDTTEYYSRSRIIINDKVAAETARCIGIVMQFMDGMEEEAKNIIWPSIELTKLRKRFERVISEIKGEL